MGNRPRLGRQFSSHAELAETALARADELTQSGDFTDAELAQLLLYSANVHAVLAMKQTSREQR